MKIKAGTDISKLFDNLHMHSFSGNCGDKDKISMFPVEELLPLLEAELNNTMWKIQMVKALSGKGISLHPDFFIWEFDNGERPAEESMDFMLETSQKYLNACLERDYSIENAKFSEEGLEELRKKYSYSDAEVKRFLRKVKGRWHCDLTE